MIAKKMSPACPIPDGLRVILKKLYSKKCGISVERPAGRAVRLKCRISSACRCDGGRHFPSETDAIYLAVLELSVLDAPPALPLDPLVVSVEPEVLLELLGLLELLPLAGLLVEPEAPEPEVPLAPDEPLDELSGDPLAPDVLPGVLLVPDASLEPDVPLVPDVPPGVPVDAPAAPLAPDAPLVPLLPEPPLVAPAEAGALSTRAFDLDLLFFALLFLAGFVPEASFVPIVPEAPEVPIVPEAPEVLDLLESPAACSRAILCASASTSAARAGSVLSVMPLDDV